MPTYHVYGETEQGVKISKQVSAYSEDEAARHAGFLVSGVKLVPEAKVQRPRPRTASTGYNGLLAAGWILRVLGAVAAMLGLLIASLAVYGLVARGTAGEKFTLMMAPVIAGAGQIVFGVFVYAAGEACYALRDIAVNTRKG